MLVRPTLALASVRFTSRRGHGDDLISARGQTSEQAIIRGGFVCGFGYSFIEERFTSLAETMSSVDELDDGPISVERASVCLTGLRSAEHGVGPSYFRMGTPNPTKC